MDKDSGDGVRAPEIVSKPRFQLIMLACEKSSYHANIYHLPEATVPWLFPALEICGLALQVLAIYRGSRTVLLCGLAMVIAGAIVERDLSLLAGDLVASLCCWIIIGRKS